MPVSDPSIVDQVAVGPAGEIVLVMIEDRRYVSGDAAVMVEDFRQKLNGYVHVVRSGQAEQLAGVARRSGVEIVLYSFDEPTPPVREMIAMAGQGLAGEGVTVTARLQPPPSINDLLMVIGPMLADAAPHGWVRIVLSATLVGDGLAGDLYAYPPSGERIALSPPPDLIPALQDMKAARWEPQHGTWVTFIAELEGTTIKPYFVFDEPPGGAGEFPAQNWAEELRRYPRDTLPDWWQDQLDADG